MTDQIADELGLKTKGKPGPKPREGNRLEESRLGARSDRGPEREDGARAERVPVHAQSSIDLDHVTPGYHGHWCSDAPGKIDKLLRAGYRFKPKDGHTYANTFGENGTDSRVSRPGGGGVQLYLMEIPIELYEEDQHAKNRIANEQMASVLPQDPDFYSRDESGKQVRTSEAVRVKTDHNAY